MSNLTKDEQDGLDYVQSIDDAIREIMIEHGPDGHTDGHEIIRNYILDNFCPKTDGDMEARYVLPGSLVIPPEKVEALKAIVKSAEIMAEKIGLEATKKIKWSTDKLNLEELLKR